MDGRVLDTSLCSFIVSGSNYGQVTSYFEEQRVPFTIASELFDVIEKFLPTPPPREHFLKLYEQKFFQYACVNLGFVFGLDRELSTKFSASIEWQKVAHRYLSLLSVGSPIPTDKLPISEDIDFINDILAAALYSLIHKTSVDKDNRFLSEFAYDLSNLVSLVSSSLGLEKDRERSFIKAFTIQTLKRAVLSSYFYITYIGAQVDDKYADTGIRDLERSTQNLIESNEEVAQWIYEDLLESRITLLAADFGKLLYDRVADVYIVEEHNSASKVIPDINGLSVLLGHIKSQCSHLGYDFYPYISKLVSLIGGDADQSFNGVKNVFS